MIDVDEMAFGLLTNIRYQGSKEKNLVNFVD